MTSSPSSEVLGYPGGGWMSHLDIRLVRPGPEFLRTRRIAGGAMSVPESFQRAGEFHPVARPVGRIERLHMTGESPVEGPVEAVRLAETVEHLGHDLQALERPPNLQG